MMIRYAIVILMVSIALALGSNVEANDRATSGTAAVDLDLTVLAKTLFGVERTPTEQPPDPVGTYANGCLSGAVQLPESGPTWQAMRLSRNRYWGHPEMIDFIERLSEVAAAQPGWSGLYIGDISQPRGGPMLTGHRSHQNGLDVDIWMLPANDLTLSAEEREKISSISMRRAEGAYVNYRWSRAHHEILKSAAKDSSVARIFVFPGAKVQMCNDEEHDRAWLRKIRPWWGHHYHFHIRLNCPEETLDCVEQASPPPGDGCGAAEVWVQDILDPAPPDPDKLPKPAPEITMADLPKQCLDVLSQR